MGVGNVSRIRVDVDLQLAVDGTSKQVTGVVNVQVSVEGRGVIKYTSHRQSGGNVCGADDHVALSSTSELCDCVTISLDLEQKSFELLNGPTTIGINIQVESTSGVHVVLSTGKSRSVYGTNDLTVDLSKNLGRKDVSQFSFSIQTVDSTEILCQFQAVLSLQGTATSFNNSLLD